MTGMTTTQESLVWTKAVAGSGRVARLDPLTTITELPEMHSVPALYVLERFSDRVSYKVTEQATYPSLEAALEAAQS